MGKSGHLPLFETRTAEGRLLYWSYAISMLTGILSIFVYRWTHFPPETGSGRPAWIGISLAELWFILHWPITQVNRCRPVYRRTFKDRLSERYEEVLPGIDIFVTTADVDKEPPLMVVDTVLSMMAYDYPPEKLHVYLSDDGGSAIMFYALLEAARFSKVWLPFCRRFRIAPLAPGAYFCEEPDCGDDASFGEEWKNVKKFYDGMKDGIDDCMRLRRVPAEVRQQHAAFREWELNISRRDHQTILEVLIGGRDAQTVDVEGKPVPTLVYLAREKRPGYPHNFKAGAMNALIRVSSRISNNPIILNVDCDQYANNPESLRDALCFFMDEEQSHNVAFVQYPQYSDNLTKNDLYGNCMLVFNEVEQRGADSNGGPMYIGSGCFHRRDVLCGKKYKKEPHIDWKEKVHESADVETCKILAGCAYEENSLWGKEMGLNYGFSCEDLITGLSVQCRGWRSISFNTKKRAFFGVAPTTLVDTLIQHTRWSTGHFQIFLSKYCPLIYGHGKIALKHQLTYCCYNLWATMCLATLFYVVVPQFCLLKGITLFPKASSPWFVAYVYVFIARQGYSLFEFVSSGGTIKGWYNEQRMWLYKRVTSYLYAFQDAITTALGLSKSRFEITDKVADDDASERYKQEVMEFGVDSFKLVIIATIALFNLFTLVSTAGKMVVNLSNTDVDSNALQMMLTGLIVVINFPVLEGMFVRKDKGSIPASVVYKSLLVAALAYLSAIYSSVSENNY